MKLVEKPYDYFMFAILVDNKQSFSKNPRWLPRDKKISPPTNTSYNVAYVTITLAQTLVLYVGLMRLT
jgi:hypothetical protein